MENINFYFDVYKIDESGESLEIQNSVQFESRYLKNAKKEIDLILNETGEWMEDDFMLISFKNNNSEIIYEGKLFKNGKWDDLTDNNFLYINKFKLAYRSDEFTFEDNRLETIENWDEIVDNFIEFEKLKSTSQSKVLKTYSQFYHWYYWPENEMFAPSKFLGYKNRTIESYDSSGTGGVTQIALSKFFNKIPKDSKEFNSLYNKLKQISKNNFGKDISSQIFEGKGGIYIPIK
ncbi:MULTISPECIES: hypothetical protein [Chryseobacterium]|uniref:hypothetical protein n=1 Tax=Chryseobacterium TaxID=59732 RepID=UPI00195A78B0|nr:MULTISPECIES: hypothetical protein [Chryseobacterium]MBM7421061.1 hypothetical protein [Chryseobacterium sp. JUb44]MDH6211019.1 hypothetical protein [Chryseobacterium sp. BIGb0186]WSO09684.1 hypothetical protein VUJ64_17845 [Chryseobacterium scophthalmum]